MGIKRNVQATNKNQRKSKIQCHAFAKLQL